MVLEEGGLITTAEQKIYVFMSFSVPKQVWKSLMAMHARYSFTFVIRGLPDNSFKTLGKKADEIGCPFIIDPNLFERFQIDRVPAFVFVDGDQHEGVYGNISFDYAIEHLQKEGKGLVQKVLRGLKSNKQGEAS